MWKSIWKDPDWSAVISTGIVAAVGAIGTYLLVYWPALASSVGAFIELLAGSSNIPHWAIALVGILAIPTVLLIAALVWNRVHPNAPQVPDWTTYVTDEFFGIRWRWRYLHNTISNLTTYCPHCDYQVYPNTVTLV
jgi:hypothetical protein